MEAVKSYIACKVRMLFDPPTSSTTMQALQNMCSELEWRLNVLCDNTSSEVYTESEVSDIVDDALGVILNEKY